MADVKVEVKLSSDGKDVILSIGGHEAVMSPQEVMDIAATLRKLGVEMRENRMSPATRELLQKIRRNYPPE